MAKAAKKVSVEMFMRADKQSKIEELGICSLHRRGAEFYLALRAA